MPPLYPTAIAMSFELATYGFVSGFLYKNSKWQCIISLYRALIIAMICGRIVWGIVTFVLLGINGNAFTFDAFIKGSLISAIPGIIFQLIFISILMLALDKTGLVRFQMINKTNKVGSKLFIFKKFEHKVLNLEYLYRANRIRREDIASVKLQVKNRKQSLNEIVKLLGELSTLIITFTAIFTSLTCLNVSLAHNNILNYNNKYYNSKIDSAYYNDYNITTPSYVVGRYSDYSSNIESNNSYRTKQIDTANKALYEWKDWMTYSIMLALVVIMLRFLLIVFVNKYYDELMVRIEILEAKL